MYCFDHGAHVTGFPRPLDALGDVHDAEAIIEGYVRAPHPAPEGDTEWAGEVERRPEIHELRFVAALCGPRSWPLA